MGLYKIAKILAWVFGIAGIATYVMILAKGDKAIEIAADNGDVSAVNPIYTVALIVFVLLLGIVLVFVLKGLAQGNIKKTLMSIGAFLVVVAISYGLAQGVETPMGDDKVLSASGSRWAGAGLYAFYILAIVAIGAMLWSGVKKLTSK